MRPRSYEPEIRVRDGGATIPLDRRPGADAEVTLAHPVATYRDESYAGATIAVYTLRVSTDTGTSASLLGNPKDDRYLGVFVRRLPPAPATAPAPSPR